MALVHVYVERLLKLPIDLMRNRDDKESYRRDIKIADLCEFLCRHNGK
jgi:hypothetical protein